VTDGRTDRYRAIAYAAMYLRRAAKKMREEHGNIAAYQQPICWDLFRYVNRRQMAERTVTAAVR